MSIRSVALAGVFIMSVTSPLALGQSRPANPGADSAAWGVFNKWDLNKDGRIDQSEFQSAMKSMGQRMDSNHDGMVDKGEFMGFMGNWWDSTSKDKGDKMTVDQQQSVGLRSGRDDLAGRLPTTCDGRRRALRLHSGLLIERDNSILIFCESYIPPTRIQGTQKNTY